MHALSEAAKNRGMKLLPVFSSTKNHPTMQGGALGMLELLEKPSRPTSVLTFNDAMAFGAMQAARRMKVSVPGELSIVGFDDLEMAEYFEPPLTTIRFSRTELASFAFNTLLRMVQGATHGETSLLRTGLVVRASTGPVRIC
jgi:LacI family transcriptional regulator